MLRKYRRAIALMLAVVMTYSPMMVCAQQPATEKPSSVGKAKIDLGYVTPATAAAVVVYPRHVFTAPGMEMLPVEVISAAGKKELGIDPVEIEQIVAIAEPPQAGPPRVAILVRMAKPLDKGPILAPLWKTTTEAQLKGKTYRQAKSPMTPSIYQPDDRTIVVASDDLLREIVEGGQPKAGKMSKILGRIAEPSDAMAILLVEPIRPLLAGPLEMMPLPPPFGDDVKKLPEQLNSIGVKVNLTGDMAMSLTLKATDEAAAEAVEQTIDKYLTLAQQMATAQAAQRSAGSDDPVEKAMGQYTKRMSEHMFQAIRPVRKGQTLTLATDKGTQQAQVQIAVIGVLVALLLPAVQAAREAARRVSSSNNMKQISLAMHNYGQANRVLPPAYKANKDGKPLLSWRVLILPYVEEAGLYDQFHLDEPWDSPNNKPLIAKMPKIYQNPNNGKLADGKTNYLTVRGKKTIFSGGEGTSFGKIRDGLSNTIMTVEVPNESAVVWTKPDDFEYNEENPLKGLTGLRMGGFNVGMADGSVRFLRSSIDPKVLKALFTRDGGEPISDLD